MEAHAIPSIESRNSFLVHAMGTLEAIARMNNNPQFTERAIGLHRRAQACRSAPCDFDSYEEMQHIHLSSLCLYDNVHEAENYRKFLVRLQHANTGNLLGRYLPERPWARQWSSREVFAGKCQNCPGRREGGHHLTDCAFLEVPLEHIFECYYRERLGHCEWLRNVVARMGSPPQPRTIWDDYFVRVANYSEAFGPADNKWDYERIVQTLLEASNRANGTQRNFRQFLELGWEYTMQRIDVDAGTVVARVDDTLPPDRIRELEEAVLLDARMYYCAPPDADETTGEAFSRRPRSWVLDALRRDPPTPVRYITWGRTNTVDRVWPIFRVDEDSNVSVDCQFRETGRRRWYRRFVGKLGGPGAELDAIVRFNRADPVAMAGAIAMSAQLDREWEQVEEHGLHRGFRGSSDSGSDRGGGYASSDDGNLAGDEAEKSEVESDWSERDDEAGENSSEYDDSEFEEDNDEDEDEHSVDGLSHELAAPEWHYQAMESESMSSQGSRGEGYEPEFESEPEEYHTTPESSYPQGSDASSTEAGSDVEPLSE
ncbi:hypothetical protein EsH8_III_001019 [Colletotrichum jinshuiense]